MKRIVIVGAGYAGVEAALTLHRKFRRDPEVEITLINKDGYHTLLTELHEVAGNRIEDDGVLVPLKSIFQYTKVKLVEDAITEFDLQNNVVASESARYGYDYLVLAVGSKPAFYGIEGMCENAFTLWSHKDALTIKEKIRSIFAEASREKNPQRRRDLLTFIVGGGGFTGVELAGELARWKYELAREFDIRPGEVSVLIVEAMGKILTCLPDSLVAKSMAHLKAIGVDVLTNSPITKVTKDAVHIKDGQVIPTKCLMWTGGVEACSLGTDVDLDVEKRGRLKVNEFCQTKHKNVYAVGDVSNFIANGQPLPALVESAIQTGRAAALNIAADIQGKELKKCEPKLHGTMVSIGRWYGVASLMGINLTGIFAIIMKHLVNLHYLFGIAGFEQCVKYLGHEFNRKRQWQNPVERHFVESKNVFWLLPIRLFLGWAWLAQGLQKIHHGWLFKVGMVNEAMAGKIDAAKASLAQAQSVLASQSAAAAAGAQPIVDATASASQAASTAAQVITAPPPPPVDVTAAASQAASTATQVASQALSVAAQAASQAASMTLSAAQQAVDAATQILDKYSEHYQLISRDASPEWYRWFVDKFIVGHELLMQRLLITAEVGLGILLLLGLFTFIAGAVSFLITTPLLISIGFTQAGGHYPTGWIFNPLMINYWWYVPASIAVMAGAGVAFGLDQYAMPYLYRMWRYLVRNRRINLFLFRS